MSATRPYLLDGEECQVPRHINRLDSHDHRIHGWQIKVDRKGQAYYSRFFADNKEGGPEKALAEACRHLFRLGVIPGEDLPTGRVVGQKPKIVWRYRKSRIYASLIVQLASRRAEAGQKRYVQYAAYIGTVNTVTQRRIDTASLSCMKAQLWAKDMIAEHGRDALFKAKTPKFKVTDNMLDKGIPFLKVSKEEVMGLLKKDKAAKSDELPRYLLMTKLMKKLTELEIGSLRLLELMVYLQIGRTPFEIERDLRMDRMTVKKLMQTHSGLIEKIELPVNAIHRGRGRPPIAYRLTAFGQEQIAGLEFAISPGG